MKNLPLNELVRLSLTLDGSIRRAARFLGVAPGTVRKIRTTVAEYGLSWPELKDLDDAALERIFRTSKRRLTGKREPDWVWIHEQMQQKGQTLLEVWERYRLDGPEDAYAYSQFTHLYRQFVIKLDLTMRQVHYAGECVFVDYAGRTIPWRDPEMGKIHQAQIFVAVLGCSNYTFVWACRSQSLEDWIEAHVRMLTFFGGVPQVLVPDNLKSAVARAGADPVLNRTYQDLARHYDTVIAPTRVRKPRDKGKVEVGVLLATRWITVPLRRRTFFSVADINAAIAEELPKLNQRAFKRLPGCRTSRFEALDKPALKPLPEQPFEFAEWTADQKVGTDYHVYVHDHAYSVPFRLVGERVEARSTARTVEIFHRHQRVASHIRSHTAGLHTTDPNHRPPKHQAYAELTPARFTQWAERRGTAAVKAIEAQFHDRPDHSIIGRKACCQLQQLARLYGDTRFEAACRRADAIGSLTVKSIRSILQRRLDQAAADDAPVQANLPLHHNVRGATYYRGNAPHAHRAQEQGGC